MKLFVFNYVGIDFRNLPRTRWSSGAGFLYISLCKSAPGELRREIWRNLRPESPETEKLQYRNEEKQKQTETDTDRDT